MGTTEGEKFESHVGEAMDLTTGWGCRRKGDGGGLCRQVQRKFFFIFRGSLFFTSMVSLGVCVVFLSLIVNSIKYNCTLVGC